MFDDKIVRHQVKYLGLMENLRVRRAGFAYRRHYELFLKRYKPLCPSTWPNYNGAPKSGVEILCKHLAYSSDDVKFGKTKIFIRFPRVLFATEDALQNKKHDLATIIQAKYKCYNQRQKYLKKRAAAIKIESTWRMYTAKKLLKKRKKAAEAVRAFIKGFILRNKPPCKENRVFTNYRKYAFLTRLKGALPKNVLDKQWPSCPQNLEEASKELKILHTRNMVLRYCKRCTPEKKAQMQQKLIAEKLFKGKKQSYPESIRRQFESNRLDPQHEIMSNNNFKTSIKPANEEVYYSCMVTKYDRNSGYSARSRGMILTTETIYILNEKDFKLKEKIPLSYVKAVSLSNLKDGIFILHLKQEMPAYRGDVILCSQFVIETIVKIVKVVSRLESSISINEGNITHERPKGKQGLVEFTPGPKYSATKSKAGTLAIVAEQ